MLRYPIGSSSENILIVPSVLEHFSSHCQNHFFKAEAGGQIFARFDARDIIVEKVTGPNDSDQRSRYSYVSCRAVAQAEVDVMYGRGLYYVGEWHTHPQLYPQPSWRDKVTMASRVRCSRHRLNGLIFIIVGTAAFPSGLKVMVHDGRAAYTLSPLSSQQIALDFDSAGSV